MKGREVALSYWSAPDAIFDEPSEAVHWARSAWDAAARGQAAKAARQRRGSPGRTFPKNGPVTRT